VVYVVVFWLLYEVWRSPRRNDLATYGAFAVAVVAILPGLLAWARRRSLRGVADDANLDRAVEELARAVQVQWEKAAGERGLTGADPIQVTWASPTLAISGPKAAAISSRRSETLPGLLPVGAAQVSRGQVSDLHALYGGLGSGRLIITGAPGSGKSSAAVLLVLAALRYRGQASSADRAKIPVPVLVTAQDWDPDSEPVACWLARQLQATYPQLPGLAGEATVDALMTAGRIAVIIDGLDEISADMQPVALRALSQHGGFRTVILSRTGEMASAASHQGILLGAAAIELQSVSPAEAVSYLERAQLDPLPDGWHDLIRHLRDNPAGSLSRALDTPLTLSLVRDTCQSGDDAREFLAFCAALNDLPGGQAAEIITDYLLDRVLPTAYTHQPGQPALPYDLPSAQNALAKIAVQMNHQGTRDLYWWDIPNWAPRTQRQITSGLAAGLAAWLIGGLAVGITRGLTAGLVAGLVAGLAAGLAAGLTSVGGHPPGKTTKLQLLKALNRTNLLLGLAAGLTAALAAGLDVGLGGGPGGGLRGGATAGLAAGLTAGLATGLAAGLVDATTVDPGRSSSLGPATTWRLNWNYTRMVMLTVGLAAALTIGLTAVLTIRPKAGLDVGLRGGLTFGLAAGLAAGLAVGLATSDAWPAFIASAQIAIKWRTPVRLMTFLEDAHSRNVLRSVGPAYQFRHAHLQDRLAAAASLRGDTIPVQARQASNQPPVAVQPESSGTTPFSTNE
jgi:hypothetical protein